MNPRPILAKPVFRSCQKKAIMPVVFLSSLALLLLLWTPLAFSQVNLGRIGGTITDQSGGAIVGATVTVTDVARGVSRTLATDAAGVYSAPNLTPGTYTIHAEFRGFKSVDRQDILVQVGQDVRIDLSLQPGEQTQTVTVTGEQAEVNTTNAQLGGTITNQTATDLPIAGRTFLYLLNYRPGLETKPGAGGGLIQYSNGMRPDYNIYVFDGLADVNSWGTAGPLNIGFQAGGPDESVILSVDAVQEMDLVENPKAEYGWRPGAQINIGLKSGTNTIHGTAFAIGRDTSLDTANPFTGQVAPTAFEQFGGTIGGPIKKDKVFYYLGYEAQRYNVGNPKNIIVPTLAPGAGTASSFPDAINDMLNKHGFTPATLNPLSMNLAGCTATGAAAPYTVTCTPNTGLFSNNTARTSFPTDFPDNGGSDSASAKIDYHLNDKNSLNLDFFRGIGYVNAPVGNVTQPYWASNILGSVTVGRVVWASVPSSSWVNEVRAGWDYSLQTANPGADCVTNPNHPNYSALGYVSGAQICGIAAITISGFGSYPGTPTMGQPEGIWAKSLNYRFSDNLSHTSGNHSFKFGAEVARQVFDGRINEYLSKGAIAFGTSATTGVAFPGATPLEDFLNGVPSAEQIQTGNLRRTVTYNQFAFYAQDDWRLRPRLTLNLGVRYEYETPLTEPNNLLGNFDPATPSGLVQANGDNLYRGYPWMFEPRLGLAWDVTGNGTTVVHSGFNISYYLPTAAEFFNPTTLQNTPTAFNLISPSGTRNAGGTIDLGNVSVATPARWNVNTPIFSSLVGQTAVCSNTAPCKIAAVDPHLTDAQFFLWNVGVQHAFTNNLTMDISYVGNHGEHMLDPVDINQPRPGVSGGPAENSRRPYVGQFPYFSNILLLSAWQRSNYNGLQGTLTERVTHGLTFTAGYTYSHAFDMAPGEIQEVIPQDSTNRNAEYGSGVLDVRHRFTLEGTYALPGKKSPGQILGGWVISSATQIWSPLPYGPIDPTDDISGTGEGQDRWDLIGNASDFNGYGRRTPIPCFGAAGSSFAKVARCSQAVPAACTSAAASLPMGPGGTTGTQSLAKYGCYVSNGSVIVPPAQGTFGTMQRDALRGQGFRVWDATIMKNFVFKERFNVQGRVEFYNLLNSTQFAQLSAAGGANLASPASFGASTGTPNVIANSPIIGNGDTRRIQLGLRLQF
jgi:outer membrane receptor protein involved in Fe transport